MTVSGKVSATTRSRNFPSSIEPTKVRISCPDTSFHASIRSASERIGVSESVECWVCQRRREKLSTTETSWPRAEKRIAVGQPRYPSPPRMRTRIRARRVAGNADYPACPLTSVFTYAGVFPPELTALRAGGLIFALALIAFAIWRRHQLSNGAVL